MNSLRLGGKALQSYARSTRLQLPDPISVRRPTVLHPASFRQSLGVISLLEGCPCVLLSFTSTWLAGDFHPRVVVHARHT